MQPHETQSTGTAKDAGHSAAKAPSGKSGWTLTILAILLMLGLGAGFLFVQHRRHKESAALEEQSASQSGQAPDVDVVTVNFAPETESVAYPGETRGWYESTIYARVSGYVAKWFVDIGDRVKKGQVLATIETPDLDAQLQAAQNQLAVSQAQVEVVKAQSEFAKSTYARWRDSPSGVVSDQEREEKKAEYSSSVAQLHAAEAKVSADQADVDRLVAMESFKNVTAPYDGVITSRHIDIGDLVTSGSTNGTSSLYTVAQIDEIRVFVDVPQRATAGMDLGVTAVATASELTNQTFAGKITRTSRALDPATRTLRVEVDINNPDLKLVPGMYLQVSFQMKHKGLLRVPASALIFKEKSPQVVVVTRDNKVDFRNVSIAQDNGDFVELGSGVRPGEQVALNISDQVGPGDTVTPTDVDSNDTSASGASTQPAAPRAIAANVPPAN